MTHRVFSPSSIAIPAFVVLLCLATPASAQIGAHRVSAQAVVLVSAIAEMASHDVGGAMCADSRHRRASVLSFALAARERRWHAALARHDATAEREERAVALGLLDAIRTLHAEAAMCVGVPASPPVSAEPRFDCILEIAPEVPAHPFGPARADAPHSAVSE